MSHDFQIAPTSDERPIVSWTIRELAGYSDEAFWADFARASKQRQEKIVRLGEQCDNPSNKAKVSLLAYMTLWDLLEQTYGIADAPLFDYENGGEHGQGSKGKPTLAGHPNVHFSLSHTGNAVLAVVANVPVGADIQAFHMPSQRLLSRALSNEERQDLEGLGDQEKALAFTQMWTRKEAFLKMTGKGIRSLHDLKLEVPEATVFEEGVSAENGFAWSICAKPGTSANQWLL